MLLLYQYTVRDMDIILIELGTKLAEAAAKNGFDVINTKMNLARQKKDLDSQASAYESIINELIQNNNDLIFISNQYKKEYEKVTISDNDIIQLQNTIKNIIELLPSSDNEKSQFELIANLLNKDTLKTMQLIGFNYKKAIGEPLTEALANFIKNKLRTRNNKKR